MVEGTVESSRAISSGGTGVGSLSILEPVGGILEAETGKQGLIKRLIFQAHGQRVLGCYSAYMLKQIVSPGTCLTDPYWTVCLLCTPLHSYLNGE